MATAEFRHQPPSRLAQYALSLEQRLKIDDRFQAELKRIGSDLPYAEFADLAE